jgi:NTP pyrophosphatase (non-canonical NTP hydrolase)
VNERRRRGFFPMPSMIGHPSGDEPLMVDVRQSGSGSAAAIMGRGHSGIADRLHAGVDSVTEDGDLGARSVRDTFETRTIGMDDAWGTIEEIIKWLDGGSTLGPEITKLIRIMKLTEEAGEVTQAVIGTLGQNPRKGVTHTWEDVQAELCDVIITAMVALTTLTPDARETFNGHLARVGSRSLGIPRTAAAPS